MFIELLCILPLILFSQNKNIYYGVKLGINYSNYIDNIDSNSFTHIPADYTGRIGFHIGAYTNIEINEIISIQSKLLIFKTGSKATIEFKDLQNNYTNQDAVLYQETKGIIDEHNNSNFIKH